MITNIRNENFSSGVSDDLYNETVCKYIYSYSDIDTDSDSDSDSYGMVSENRMKIHRECCAVSGYVRLAKYIDYNYYPIGSVKNEVPMRALMHFIYDNGGLIMPPVSIIKSANKF
jgi:hypothetical protein